MLLGYARISTDDQKLDMQLEALTRAGVDERRIYRDSASGATTDRPGLEAALIALRPGDVLVVWRLDRLGRSLKDLIALTERIKEAGAGFRSLGEAIDTTTPAGQLFFHIFGAIAQFERALIVERTRAGLAAARKKGRRGGRPAKIQPKQINAARAMIDSPEITAAEVAAHLGVHRSTLYRTLRKAATKEEKDP